MARDDRPGAKALYGLHHLWISDILPNGGSLLVPGAAVWTDEHLQELFENFVGRPDESKEKRFLDKLHDQMAGVSPEGVQLMAELHVVHFLCISNAAISATTKRRDVEAILSWMPVPIQLPNEIGASFSPGFFHPGPWVLTRRDTQLAWLIDFALVWRRLPPDARSEQLASPAVFKELVLSIEGVGTDGARQGMLHMTHPDAFESVVSMAHKDAIVRRFADYAGPSADIDQRLLAIRQALTESLPEGFSWYDKNVHALWWKPDTNWKPFLTWIERIRALPSFDADERDYKLYLAGLVARARDAVRAGLPDWGDALSKSLKDSANNIVGWRTRDPFLEWVAASPDVALGALTALWADDGRPWERLGAFIEKVPPTVLRTRGPRLNLGSYLLMGEDVTSLPPFKVTMLRDAFKLVGWPPDDDTDDDSDVYRRGLTLFEEIHREGRDWAHPLRDPLDAQGAVWTLVSTDGCPEGWAEEWCQELARYQSASVGTSTPGDLDSPSHADAPMGAGQPVQFVDHIEQAAGDLNVDRRYLDEIVQLLEDKGQVVLYGPPGTGKTYLALRLARAIAEGDDNRLSIVQFHPATTYEDFVEGLRPRLTEQGQVTYEVVAGPLVRIAESARADPERRRHVLIVDEINRANLPKVFGELLFLLEYRSERAYTVHRPDAPFGLPENLWLIGTMNSADRSIALIDSAMRRRFHCVPFFPHEGAMAGLLGRWLGKRGGRIGVARLVDAVNEELRTDLGDHLLIGPSHFMRTDLSDAALERIWTYNIFPLLEEQYWGDRAAIDRWRWRAVRRRYSSAVDGTSPHAEPEPADGEESVDEDEVDDLR